MVEGEGGGFKSPPQDERRLRHTGGGAGYRVHLPGGATSRARARRRGNRRGADIETGKRRITFFLYKKRR